MILKFTFEAPTNQGIIEKICKRCAKETGVELGLSRDLKNIYAYVEAIEEKLEEFSKVLANELPISIFLKSLNAEVVDEFRDDLDMDFPKLSLPPCPRCLREVKDEKSSYYFDIFHHCEICGYDVKKIEINSKELIYNLAKKLESENIIIQTMNGIFEISKNLKEAEFIVARDLASVAKYFMAFEGDAKALASIEKPFVKLKTNLEFKKTFGLSTPAYDVKLPDDMILELLFFVSDFELLGFKKAKKARELVFEVKTQKALKAVVTDSVKKDILIYEGERGLMPAFEKFVKEGVVGRYKNYIAYSKKNKSIITFGDEGKSAKAPYASFYGVLTQWDLEEKNIMGFCFYKDDESKVFIHSSKFGLVEFIDFKFKFKNIEEIFSLIGSMNDTGKKLIENFSKKRANLFSKALNSNIETDKRGIFYLWGLIGVVLGFGSNIDEAAEKLLKYANEAMTKKGPRIDYKVENNKLNPLWAIRTAMSFNLAGVDNYMLSYGVIESFAEFLSNIYESVNKDTELSGAIIAGDLFEGEFLNKIYSYIDKNYSVFVPRGLPISGQIEAYGSLVINSKV